MDIQADSPILRLLLSFKEFFDSFSVMADVTIWGVSFGTLFFYLFLILIALYLKRDEDISPTGRAGILLSIVFAQNYIAYKGFQYPVDWKWYAIDLTVAIISFAITFIPYIAKSRLVLLGIFLFGNAYFLFVFYTNSINKYEYQSYNILTYHVDKAEVLLGNAARPDNLIEDSKFKTKAELFRYYYYLAKKDPNAYVRSRLYEVRKEISDMDEVVGMSKIVYDTDKFYGRDGEGKFYFCNLNRAEMFKTNSPVLLKKQVDLNNAVIVLFQGEKFVSDLRKVPCREITVEKIIPDGISQEQLSHFIEVIGKEVLFGDMSNELFTTLREIKTLGETLKAKVVDRDERIRLIYSYVARNIKYDKVTSDNLFRGADLKTLFSQIDNKYHSGIMTYKNKVGVCTGYSNLFFLLSTYAGIDNVEVILGKSYDPMYKEYVGHAWNKIGDSFYDTTYESTGNSRLREGILLYYKRTANEMFNIDRRIADLQKLNPLKITQQVDLK